MSHSMNHIASRRPFLLAPYVGGYRFVAVRSKWRTRRVEVGNLQELALCAKHVPNMVKLRAKLGSEVLDQRVLTPVKDL